MRAGALFTALLIAGSMLISVPAIAQDHMHGEMMEGEGMMDSGPATIVVHHKVADFDKWLPAFESHSGDRGAAGCTAISVYQDASDPTMVTVVATFESLEKAEAFGMSEDLAKKMEDSGVVGEPDVHFLHHYGDYEH